MTEFEMIAKTFQGLEGVLAKELTELGANNIQIGNRMVSFSGDKALLYKANFHLRTAIRILKPFLHFKADSADQVYEICLNRVDWSSFMDVDTTFAVDAVVYSEEFRHSKFVAYRVKDAIADYFREKSGKRPSVSVSNPDLTFHIHISHDDCSLSLDSSGESLHRRGYRQDTMEAPLNEVLAAGMLLLAGWDGQTDFIDPMCGSGTLPIEAALIARNMAPGLFRSRYAFEKWKDFDRELFESIYNDDSMERPFEHRIYGSDKDAKAIAVAKRNARAAGCTDIDFQVKDFKDYEAVNVKTLLVTNPPYGERLKPEDLFDIYSLIGERLKHAFTGCEAWIISYRYECFDKIGLKPSEKIPLYNGALPCEFRKYEIFDGKYRGFREEGQTLEKSNSAIRKGSTLKNQARRAEKLAQRETEGNDNTETSYRNDRRTGTKSTGSRNGNRERGDRKNIGRGDRKSFGEIKSYGEKKYGARSSDGEKSSFSRKKESEGKEGNGTGMRRGSNARYSKPGTRDNRVGKRSYGEKKIFGEKKSFGNKKRTVTKDGTRRRDKDNSENKD